MLTRATTISAASQAGHTACERHHDAAEDQEYSGTPNHLRWAKTRVLKRTRSKRAF